MKSSTTLINAIKRFESCALKAYKDQKGVWTIGYGHTAGVKSGDKITLYQAEQLLREDLAKFEKHANMVKRISTQGKYDAIVDFMFNLGTGTFDKSTLRAYIESGRSNWEIQEQFLRWVYCGKMKLGGLVSRRIWEAARFDE